MELYRNGPVKTLIVEGTSVPLLAEDIKPTSGRFADCQAEYAQIQAIGPLYIETGGDDATTASFPMGAGDYLEFKGYENIKNIRVIRNVNSTTLVWFPGYR